MYIDKKILLDFIGKGTLNCGIDKTIFYFNEKEVKIIDDYANVIFCVVKLNSSNFEEYKPIGEVGIKDIRMFEQFASRFASSVELIMNKNIIIMKSAGKSIETKVADPDFIEKSELKEDSIIYGQEPFKIRLSELKEVAGDVKLFLGTSMKITTREKEIEFSIQSDDNVIKKIIVNPNIKHESISTINSEYFKKIVDCLTEEEISINTKTTFPIMFGEEGKKITVKYFLAPIGENDDEEEEKK